MIDPEENKRMKELFFGITIFGTFVFLALFAYFPIVWLNLVFTFGDLTSSNIPYYDNASSSYDRYNSMWWIIATDILRFVGPGIATYTITLILLQRQGYLAAITWYIIVMVILVILEAFKVVVFTWQFVYCGSYQLCRNFDPSGNPESANYVFLTMWIYDMAFLFIWIIYSVLSDTIRRYALKLLTENLSNSEDVPVLQLNLNHDNDWDGDESDDMEYKKIASKPRRIDSEFDRPRRSESQRISASQSYSTKSKKKSRRN